MGPLCLLFRSFLEWPIWAHEVLLFGISLGATLTIGREIWRFFRPYRKVKHGIEQIAYHFRGKNAVHIFGLYHDVPSIEVVGRFMLSDKEKEIQRKSPLPLENDPHAIVVVEPEWTQTKLHFEVKSLTYHELKALRNAMETEDRPGLGQQRSVRVLSANAIILCRKQKEIILHFRSAKSATYPLCYHTLGGGYMPPDVGAKDDSDSLKNTLAREVEEEARIKLSLEKIPPLLIMEEVRTGFIQVAFLGLNITAEQSRQLPDNPRPVEGRPVKISFDELEAVLSHPDWVPTGKAAVLAWLALGAPGAGPYVRFGKSSAAGLCERILKKTHFEHAVASHPSGR
jgi:hypothetical protein